MSKTFTKRSILTFFGLFLAWNASAQYGNEWVKFNQQYYKIPVGRDGLYRLTYTDLQNAGFPVGSSDPRRVQIFHRGVEQRIIVQGENDGVFNPGDYIEFYGKKNDGVSDAELYQPETRQPHQYYNLYSDTTVYFLTVNPLAVLGLRMENSTEINVTNIPAEVYHTDEKLTVLATDYTTGVVYSSFLQNTFFDTGEGWTGALIFTNEFIDYLIENIVNTSTASGTPELEIQVVGRAEVQHRVEISVGPSSPSRIVATQNFAPLNVATIRVPLNWSDIGADGRIRVRVKALGVSGSSDRLSASYIKVNYPQGFNQAGASSKIFQLRENVSNKSYIEIQNTPANTRIFDITDPANVKTIRTTTSATLNAVIPATAVSRKILTTNSFSTPSVRPVSFRNIDPAAHDYIIISHKNLMKPAGEYSNVVKAYGGYRASQAGGSYDTLVVDIDQLYNQFNYGEISPLAIFRFMKMMVDNGDPRHLFIIGKGLDVSLGYHRNSEDFEYHDFVPSAGMPASDICFTAGLTSSGFEPAVATGRITANTPADVAAYLNKVKETDALSYDDLWRKELLHLSGGINAGEPELFKTYLEGFAAIAESFYLGGHVTPIAKNNTEIEFINISDKVNSGVGLVTLFGHSSPTQNDFNIGYVSAPELGYNNPGKYPMFLINGCNAGDFFRDAIRYGEDWINTPSKGAVGFMANTSFGYSQMLRAYSNTFYTVAYGDSSFIYKGIGDIQKEVVRRFSGLGSSVAHVTQGQQMLLLGDPAVKLFDMNRPDYETNDNHVYAESFNTEPITALSDSFAIKIIVRNFGRADADSIAVRVERTLNDNTTVSYDSLFYPVLFRDTLTFTVYKDEKGFGNNTFTVTIDPLNQIAEVDKSNNTAEFGIFIPLNAARNLFPQGFSIVNTSSINLVVQSTDVLGEARDFTIQIDTVDTFDSQYMQEFTVNGKIATKEITITTVNDTLAFYWRTKLAQPLPNESAEWSISSFTYIENGPEGWAQVHFPQYLSNETSGLMLNPQGRMMQFQETVTDVFIHIFGADHPASFTEVSVKLDQSEYNPVSLPELQCRDNTINLIVFDKTTTVPYMPLPVQFPDKRACGRRPEVITSFLSSEAETGDNDLIQYVDNVQAGDSVILFSIGNPGYSSWSANVRNKLLELGISSAQITALQAGEPVIIFARKGAAPGSALVIKTSASPADEQELEAGGTVTGRFLSGSMTSSVIGPATEWQSVEAKSIVSEIPITDEFSFDVIGITLSGDETVLKTGLDGTTENISDISADEYPYLKLVFNAADEINTTAPQLKHWIVSYTPAPEGVLTFAGSTETQTLQEGEVWTGSYGFQNISAKEFSDSLTVNYTVYNTTSRTSDNKTKKIKAPLPGEETGFEISVNTFEKAGLNDVKVFVNPRVLPELYYDNNVLELHDHLDVTPDIFNPVLDVTIDGRYIADGDYVSPNPSIVIKLWDENTLLPKTDTLGVTVVLQYPCPDEDCPFTAIYFTRPDVQWQPATGTSDFTMTFIPQNLPAGLYTLRAEAKDVRNNSAGTLPYEITFVVAEDNTVTIQRPYPNPSSSSFFFNVIVTGDTQPDAMHLEIINANGQVVGQFTRDKFFTGTNMIIWDAESQPDGLYLYRMYLIQQGKEMKKVTGKLMLTH